MLLKLVINDNCEENVSKHTNVFPEESSLFGFVSCWVPDSQRGLEKRTPFQLVSTSHWSCLLRSLEGDRFPLPTPPWSHTPWLWSREPLSPAWQTDTASRPHPYPPATEQLKWNLGSSNGIFKRQILPVSRTRQGLEDKSHDTAKEQSAKHRMWDPVRELVSPTSQWHKKEEDERRMW